MSSYQPGYNTNPYAYTGEPVAQPVSIDTTYGQQYGQATNFSPAQPNTSGGFQEPPPDYKPKIEGKFEQVCFNIKLGG